MINSLSWLKRMNAKGSDVHVAPAGEHGLVLLNQLTKKDLSTLEAHGFAPAVAIETRRGQFDAWIKLADRPVPQQMREIARRGLLTAVGKDAKVADAAPAVRLAGLTNRGAEQGRAGHHPFVLVQAHSGKVSPGAPAYLQRIGQRLEREQAERDQAKALEHQRSKGRGFER